MVSPVAALVVSAVSVASVSSAASAEVSAAVSAEPVLPHPATRVVVIAAASTTLTTFFFMSFSSTIQKIQGCFAGLKRLPFVFIIQKNRPKLFLLETVINIL